MSCSTHGRKETYECLGLKEWSFLHRRRRNRWKDIRKMKNKVIKFEVMIWVDFSENRIRCQPVVNVVTHRVAKKERNSLTSCVTVSFSNYI
jgi:hypothetical protein